MRESPSNVSYNDLYTICEKYFGSPRQTGGSHAVFRTPWPGDPRVNIQRSNNGNAKNYQVRQALEAIEMMIGAEDDDDASEDDDDSST